METQTRQIAIKNIKDRILDSKDIHEIKRCSLLAIALLRNEYDNYITDSKCQVGVK